mmetsp:Transcript_90040/g.240517  ORF Transcript_90040/g.240517 Transcript_90040/m.240517 type:complete len:195 (-) Transcript_90040:31-615(-)
MQSNGEWSRPIASKVDKCSSSTPLSFAEVVLPTSHHSQTSVGDISSGSQDSCDLFPQSFDKPRRGSPSSVPVLRTRHGLRFDTDALDSPTRQRVESNRRSAAAARGREKVRLRQIEEQLRLSEYARARLAVENEQLRYWLQSVAANHIAFHPTAPSASTWGSDLSHTTLPPLRLTDSSTMSQSSSPWLPTESSS